MSDKPVFQEEWVSTGDEGVDAEVRRVGARLRHFRGVAGSVMDDALRIWSELRGAFQDSGPGMELPNPGEGFEHTSEADRTLLLEKLDLLGARIEFARKLCTGTIGAESQKQGDQKHE
ncbi:MAG: hypothetical protein AAGU11_04940 [Syntrophobacteraceae bacterium]